MKQRYGKKQILIVSIGIIALVTGFLIIQAGVKNSLEKQWALSLVGATQNIELTQEGYTYDLQPIMDVVEDYYVGNSKVKFICYYKNTYSLNEMLDGRIFYSDFETAKKDEKFSIFLRAMSQNKAYTIIENSANGYYQAINIEGKDYYIIFNTLSSYKLGIVGFVDKSEIKGLLSIISVGFVVLVFVTLFMTLCLALNSVREVKDIANEKEELIKSIKLKEQRNDVLSYLMNEFTFEYDIASDVISFGEKYQTIFHRGRTFIRFFDTLKTHYTIYHLDVDNLVNAYEEIKKGVDEGNFIFRLQMPGGQYEWFNAIYKVIFDEEQKPSYVVGKILNVHESQKEKEVLLNKSTKDPLTGLLNRGELEKRTNIYMENMEDDEKAALLIMDLDHFKSVNDTFGHSKGDDLLKEVAGLLKAEFRTTDIVGRLGGDEFFVFMKDVSNMDDAINKCSSLLKKLEKNVTYGEMTVSISSSMGLVEVNPGNHFLDLYMKADSALYEAKENGRNQIKIYSD
ncbi:MAG: sensor domain-containing diguanylate cyclase [Lachnospiraceae bacterium]|nr:sensor domain-containing diguanylate cyclase [Lachnospiraceae bacterium]